MNENNYQPPSPDAIRVQLRKISSSTLFAQAPQQSKLLNQLCEETLNGTDLTASVVRWSDWGILFWKTPKQDDKDQEGVVRVAVARLRQKLDEYYFSGEGKNDPIRIDVPKGGYTASFCRRPETEFEPHAMILREPGATGAPEPPSPIVAEAKSIPSLDPIRYGKAPRWTEIIKTVYGIRIAAIMAVAAALLLIGRFWEAPPVRSEGPKPVPLTTSAPEAPILAAAISPDGQHVAYSDGTHLYVRPTRDASPRPLHALPVSKYLMISWFPDGTRLLVSGLGAEDDLPGLWVLSVVGQEFRQLRKGVERGAVAPDGSTIAFVSGDGHHVGTMDAHGGNAGIILDASDEDTFNELGWSSDGAWVLVGKLHLGAFDLNVSIESIRPSGGKSHVLVAEPTLRSMCEGPNGRIIYAQAEAAPRENDVNLWEMRMDLRTGQRVGAPRRLTNWVDATSAHGLSISMDGHRLTFLKGPYQADVHIGELTDRGTYLKTERRLTWDDRDDLPTAITPDGKAVFFHSNRSGRWQVYRQETAVGTNAELLVSGPDDYRGARLSPDGNWLLYFDRAQTGGGWGWASTTHLRALPLHGGAPVPLSEHPLTFINARCARPPSELCVLSERDPLDVARGNLVFYSLVPGKGRGPELARTWVGRSLKQSHWDLSPDGSSIAVIADSRSGSGSVRVLFLNGQASRDVIVRGRTGLQSMDWSADGHGWYVSRRSGQGAQLLFIDAATGHARTTRYQQGSFGTWAFASADGQTLAFLEWSATGNIWMAEGLSAL